MGNRRIILILLGGIAFCAALLWGLRRERRAFARDASPMSNVTDTAMDTVERVTIDRGDTRIGLGRISGKWFLTAPFSAHVEQGAVVRLLDAFETARVKDVLPLQEIRRRELSLREFGFSPARMQVTLEGPQRRDVLLFGSFTPSGKECYLRVNGNDHILVASATLPDALPRTADDLRSRKLFYGNRDAIRTLEVRAPGHPFITLSRGDNGAWALVQPFAAPASAEKVEALIDVLDETPVSHFVWPTVSNVMHVAEAETAVKARLGLYGLSPDSGIQLFIQEAEPSPTATLIIGHPLDRSAALSYILLPGGEAIGAVPNTVADAFRLSAFDLRDNRPFTGSAPGVRRLQVHIGDTLCVLTQTNAAWRFEAPVAGAADEAAVRNTLDGLLRLRAESPADASSRPKDRDPKKSRPVSHVELVSDQGAWRFTVEPDDPEGRFLNLVFPSTSMVFRVASSNMPRPLVSMDGLLELHDKTILALPKTSLRRITVKRGSVLWAAERNGGEAAWTPAEGSTGRLDPERLDALASALGDIRADRVEAIGFTSEHFAAYGLQEPWIEISVDVDAQDAVRKVLLVGKEYGAGKKRYAAVRGLDVLFVLPPETLAALSARFIEPPEG